MHSGKLDVAVPAGVMALHRNTYTWYGVCTMYQYHVGNTLSCVCTEWWFTYLGDDPTVLHADLVRGQPLVLPLGHLAVAREHLQGV